LDTAPCGWPPSRFAQCSSRRRARRCAGSQDSSPRASGGGNWRQSGVVLATRVQKAKAHAGRPAQGFPARSLRGPPIWRGAPAPRARSASLRSAPACSRFSLCRHHGAGAGNHVPPHAPSLAPARAARATNPAGGRSVRANWRAVAVCARGGDGKTKARAKATAKASAKATAKATPLLGRWD